jgi:hypothetical protein
MWIVATVPVRLPAAVMFGLATAVSSGMGFDAGVWAAATAGAASMTRSGK